MKLCSIFCVAVPSLPKQNINMEKDDTVGRVVNWNNRISCSDKWYEHVPGNVAKNEGVKPLWDFTIQTDREIHKRSPHKTKTRETVIVDISVPGDRDVFQKEIKIKAREVSSSVIVEALGSNK